MAEKEISSQDKIKLRWKEGITTDKILRRWRFLTVVMMALLEN